MTYLNSVVIEPKKQAKASIIWLHGLGASGHDFEPLVPHFNLPENLDIRFIFPHAPEIPVTINAGYLMPAWCDILSMTGTREYNLEQFQESVSAINLLIQREKEKGIPSEKIIVAGFSQGGAVAYAVALTHPEPLAGLLALSTYFPTADVFQYHPSNATLPIQIYHGDFDTQVEPELAEQTIVDLTKKGFQPSFHRYPMGHEVSMEQIQHIGKWITDILS